MANKSDYNKLRDIWYAKLKKKGFEDIENTDENLKTWSSHFAEKRTLRLMEDKRPYYELANRFLNEYKFETKLEKIIWEYHTEGLSVRDIMKILNKVKTTKTNRTTVWTVVKRLQESMKAMYLSRNTSTDE